MTSNSLRNVVIGSCLLGGLTLLAGCAGGSSGDPANRGAFVVNQISTGLSQVYPYRIQIANSQGVGSGTITNIENSTTLQTNVTAQNGVLPVGVFDTMPLLPDGNPGNQFLQFTFSNNISLNSILSPLLANQSNSGLTTAISIVAYNPVTEATTTLDGQGFINGFTYYNNGGTLELVQAVAPDGAGGVTVLDPRATGFPNYPGAEDLVRENTFVFVADSDPTPDLTDDETFPTNTLIRLIVSNAVQNTDGQILEAEVCTATTVGADPNPPNVLGFTSATPNIVPGNGDTGVSPTSSITVRFNKPVQPRDVGSFFNPQVLTPASGGVTLSVTVAANTFSVLYTADPLSFGDLCSYSIRPAYNLPGNTRINVTLQNTLIRGLGGQLLGAAATTFFTTGNGTGVVNAPVAPEAIYLGLGGSEPGVSVVDLNGFGQGTGFYFDEQGNRLSSTSTAVVNAGLSSEFKTVPSFNRNPNIGIAGVQPALSAGTSNLDSGGYGALTRTTDTNGNTRLLSNPVVGTISDIHIGAPLDLVFNNENINPNVTRANQINPLTTLRASGNTITQPPHPNPPRLVFPPPNLNQAIFGEEPTMTSNSGPAGNIITSAPPCITSPINQLVTGNPFSTSAVGAGIYGVQFEGTFVGPQVPPPSPPPPPAFCPFTSRQQVGHFLYLLDSDNDQILVVNSNRFTILDTIPLSDPTDMAIAPNVARLVVSNFAGSTLSVIDIDPLSPTFNTVTETIRLNQPPRTVAWQPDGEDLLVTTPSSLIILSGNDLEVRREVSGFLSDPIDVAVTPRYAATGFTSNVYFAYVLNRNGTIAIYESGPDGTNGIGFNDIIGTVPDAVFSRPSVIRLDWTSGNGGVLVGHADSSNPAIGVVSRLELISSPPGPQPSNQNNGGFILPPTFRQKEWDVTRTFGGQAALLAGRGLSGGSVVDFAYDDMFNFGAAPGQITQFNQTVAPSSFNHSQKAALHTVGGAVLPPITPQLIFIGLSDAGVVDVFELGTGTRVASIPAPGIRTVSSYWRQ